MHPRPMHTIAIFPKIQPDTLVALVLLKEYGEHAFPGITTASTVFWTTLPDGKTAAQCEAEGILPIDMGGGTFDHHVAEGRAKLDCASTLVAKYLGVEKDPSLQKLLAYAKRDDLEGKGTLSEDPLDRAFGLSGLITTFGRVHRDDPATLATLVLPLLRAHVQEQRQRYEENPKEWKVLKATGKGSEHTIAGMKGSWKLAVVQSDNIALPGYLRAYFGTDVVLQRLSSGHMNVITNQKKGVGLPAVVACVRRAEAAKRGVILSEQEHAAQGRVDALPMWFYDIMATTLQNGGVDPQHIEPSALTLAEMHAAVQEGLQKT